MKNAKNPITRFGYFLKAIFLSRLSISFFVIIATGLLFLECSGFLRSSLKDSLSNKLIANYSLPVNEVVDVVYILGGSQKSLKLKFKTAADLYHKGICKKILFLSQAGITEYNSLLQRNLTNNEWAILNMVNLGIPKKNIKPIDLKEGFFGTYSEAKGISALLKEKKYKSILLISAPYHTRRVKISFNSFLQDQDVSVYVQGSGEKLFLRYFIIEFIKLKVYQYFLV